jgi:hypothetical protein
MKCGSNPAAEKEGKNISEWLLCQADKCTAAKEGGGQQSARCDSGFPPGKRRILNRFLVLIWAFLVLLLRAIRVTILVRVIHITAGKQAGCKKQGD